RVTGASINTVTKLLIDAGRACEAFHNSTVRRLTMTEQRVLYDALRASVKIVGDK
ncbi:MAG: hypothetical protein RIR25_727, partial [Verrucomicrobiota bacterium]